MKKIFSLITALFCAGCTTVDPLPEAVGDFDISRYLGKWYEIARMPNWFEDGMNRVTAYYSMLPDGMIQVVNCGIANGKLRSIKGVAKFAGQEDSGDLLVSFFQPFYSSYRIIRLSPDYTTACVMGSSRSSAWILARTPEISKSELDTLLKFLKENHFDINKLIYPIQSISSVSP